jgi:hypothetical protein
MHDFNRTDAELAYWLEKYLIYRGTRSLTDSINHDRWRGLVADNKSASSQDLIGWTKFLHGKIAVNIEAYSTSTAH